VDTARAGPRELVHSRREERHLETRRPARVGHRDRLRKQIADAGFRIQREELHVTSTCPQMPAPIGRWLGTNSLTQNALISNMEYVLIHGRN
jgi:hypothetical protein